MRGLEPPASRITTERSNRTELHPPWRRAGGTGARAEGTPPSHPGQSAARAGRRRAVGSRHRRIGWCPPALPRELVEDGAELRPHEGLGHHRTAVERPCG